MQEFTTFHRKKTKKMYQKSKENTLLKTYFCYLNYGTWAPRHFMLSREHVRHVSTLARKHARHVGTWARKHAKHVVTWARKHASHIGTWARKHERHVGTWAHKARWHVSTQGTQFFRLFFLTFTDLANFGSFAFFTTQEICYFHSRSCQLSQL